MKYKLPGSGLLSYSGMATFLNCQKKYAFRYIDKIPVEVSAPALERGRAFHLLAETKGVATERQVLAEAGGDRYELAKVRTAYRQYKQMEDEGILPRVDFAEVKLLSEEHQYVGYVDAIGIDENGRWRLGEIKTTMSFNPVTWATKQVDLQIALYVNFVDDFALENFLVPEDLEGVSYRTVSFTRKQPLKPTKSRRERETPEAYEARIASDPKVYHQMVTPTTEARRGALEDFRRVKSAIHDLRGSGRNAIRNPGNCYAYNRICEYFEHCWGINPESNADMVENDLLEGDGE